MTSPGHYQTAVCALKRDLRSLVNYEYESRAARCLTGSAGIAFRNHRGRRLRRCRLLMDNSSGCRGDFEELLSNAVDDGQISDEEWGELLQADGVVNGLDGTTTVYFVAEISLIVSDRDVENAIALANTLSKATGAEAWPMVIGETIPEPQKATVEEHGVPFMEVEW